MNANVGQLLWYVTGRFFENGAKQLLDVGYFIHLQGVAGPLFEGKRSEATALFTFASEPFGTSSIDNGGLAIGIDDRGRFSIYLREQPGASFDDPTSFAAGRCIAIFERVAIVATTETSSLFSNVFSARLVSAEPFDFRGVRYNFHQLAPHGITQWGLAAPETLTPPKGYTTVVPFVGSAIRVGSE